MTLPHSESYFTIPLTQGQEAKVSLQDYFELAQYKWTASWSPSARKYYVLRMGSVKNGRRQVIWMHREVLQLPPGDRTRCVDHINLDPLDNRRSNLRIATHAENQRNRAKLRTNTTGFKGVGFDKRRNYFTASIRVNRKLIWLGSRATAEEAFALYCEAAKMYHGDFHRTQ